MNIVLLRGLGRESAHWQNFPELLMRQLEKTLNINTKIHCPNIQGCGEHYRKPAHSSLESTTDTVRTEFFLKNQKLKNQNEKLIILGLSFGGMLALDWAQRYPDEISHVILINSSTALSPFWQRLKTRALLKLVRAVARPLSKSERIFLELVSNKPQEYDSNAAQWIEIQKQHPVSNYNCIKMLIAAAAYRPPNTTTKPGLVICSELDRLVSPRCSHAIAEQFQFSFRSHPWAGHDLPMDDGHWLTLTISNWLKSEFEK